MSSKVIYERFLWFHTQVKRGTHPNASTMAEHFEISAKTAQRDIEFIRDRLFAPLVYVHARRGYAYGDHAYELPASWLSSEELTALLLSLRLASMLPDTGMKKRMKAFLDSVLSLYTGEKAMTLASLDDRVSVKNIGYSRTDGKVFQKMLDALVGREPVTIEYFSPHKSEITSRLILPLHLLSYMGTWHIVAWCAMRQGLRDFTLSRIRKIDPSGEAIDYPGTDASLKDFLRRSFGILTGGAQQEVCLKFSPEVAPWIEEQVWHPEQKARKDEGGFLLLTFPVADFREVRREILRYGPHVEVVSPGTLRDEVRGEIEKMARLYRPR